MDETTFTKLAKINCAGHIEKKGKFSYLSWPWAVQMLRENAPTATWEVLRFNGLPYLATGAGHFVEVAVTVDGITLSQIHPVLNGNNRPIESPSSFDINTSIQRCLVKAIALHGLGLYIYAGEDLPPGDDNLSDQSTLDPNKEDETPSPRPATRGSAREATVDAFHDLTPDRQKVVADIATELGDRYKEGQELLWWLRNKRLDGDERAGLWAFLNSDIRSYLKKIEAEEDNARKTTKEAA